jgi:hypothetical protein
VEGIVGFFAKHDANKQDVRMDDILGRKQLNFFFECTFYQLDLYYLNKIFIFQFFFKKKPLTLLLNETWL